jgi:transposase
MTQGIDLDNCSRGDMKHMIRLLMKQVETLESHVKEQDKRIAELEARLNEPPKNSGNSSIPPSKGFKGNKGEDPKKAGRTGARKGSLGRKGTNRPLADNPDEIVRVMAKTCEHCRSALGEENQTLREAYDKIDIPEVKPHITRVEIYGGVCPCCAKKTTPVCVPDGLEKGSPFSKNIVALALYLRIVHAVSYERLARLFRDLFGLGISEGALDAMLRRAKPSFDRDSASILARLRKSRVVYSDETGVRVGGKNWWNWVFQNDDIVLHVIRRSRGQGVIEDVLDGHRPALWVSDLYSAQQGHADKWQICLAHQLRDCRYAIEAGDTVFAPRMKRLFLRAFVVAKRRHSMSGFARKANKTRLENDLKAIMALPIEQKDAKRLHKRYQKHRRSLFTFLDYPELAPDNNSSERALRPTATYRKVTGGFRSSWGADLYAAARSTIGTAAKNGLDAFASIKSTLGISVTCSGA